MKELPKKYNIAGSEAKWQKIWQEAQIYRWDSSASGENTYSVDTPPPTISGNMHIGHMYSYTQTDFIARFMRMIGRDVFYPVGFDDNGLPTERLVEKKKKIKSTSMSRAEFVQHCHEVVEAERENFKKLFASVALSFDWSWQYNTISDNSKFLSQLFFLDLVEKDQLYRSSEPVLWDSVDRTALAQADSEDKESSSKMYDLTFALDGEDEQITIATTRPEMLPACACVFYHPEDSRYQHLKGKRVVVPLFGQSVPILQDNLVKQDKGSGLVMCCTFGDTTDIAWWRAHNLPANIIINEAGRITDELTTEGISKSGHALFKEFSGLKIKEARTKIAQMLEERSIITASKDITNQVKCAERSGAPLEIIMEPQWFVRAVQHKAAMAKLSSKLNWHPANLQHRLDDWIAGLGWDWCISRQRHFGVPIPVWYSLREGEEGKILYPSKNQLPVDPFTDLPEGYSRNEVEPEICVLDTWATSAITPQLASNAIDKSNIKESVHYRKLFPFSLRPQAHEIIRTWTFYTMLRSYLHEGSLAWSDIAISGWCLAESGDKMSKSKGNIIQPEKVIENFGADAMRYWAASSKLGMDIRYCEETVKNGKRLVNKLWNASKFCAQHFNLIKEDDKNKLNPNKITKDFDIWIINGASHLARKIEEFFKQYEYSKALAAAEKFFWRDFCDNYLEIVKKRIYDEDRKDPAGQYSAAIAQYHVLRVLLQSFAPFMPHITEEIYSHIHAKDDNDLIHKKGSWQGLDSLDSKNARAVQTTLDVIERVRSSKALEKLSVKAPVKLIRLSKPELPKNIESDLKDVTSAAQIDYKESDQNGPLVVDIIYDR